MRSGRRMRRSGRIRLSHNRVYSPISYAYRRRQPELIRWAIERSGLPEEQLLEKFPKLDEWKTGDRHPTFRQLEEFAKATMAPFGLLFLEEPPKEEIPIPDYRTVGDVPIDRPSPNLIETIQTMQRRQDWMRDLLIEEGHERLAFVGSGKTIGKLASQIGRFIRSLAGTRSVRSSRLVAPSIWI